MIYGTKIARRAGLIKDIFVYTSFLNIRSISQATMPEIKAGMPINRQTIFKSEYRSNSLLCLIITDIMIIEIMHRGIAIAANIPQNTFVRFFRSSLSSSAVFPFMPCFSFMRFVRITNGDIMIANGHNTIPTMNSKNGGTSIESNPKESTIIQKVSITQLVSTNIIKKSIQSNNPGGIPPTPPEPKANPGSA